MSKDTGRRAVSAVSAVRNEPAKLPASIDELIRRRAYELYEERGREDGRDLEDWYRAEAEIAQKKTRTAAA